jgi:hypothetical protein
MYTIHALHSTLKTHRRQTPFSKDFVAKCDALKL